MPWSYSLGMPPIAGARLPLLFIEGSEAEEVSRNVSSVAVHVTRGRARAKVQIAGPLPDADSLRVDAPATTLALMLTPDEECFAGRLTAMEARMPPGARPSSSRWATPHMGDRDRLSRCASASRSSQALCVGTDVALERSVFQPHRGCAGAVGST